MKKCMALLIKLIRLNFMSYFLHDIAKLIGYYIMMKLFLPGWRRPEADQ